MNAATGIDLTAIMEREGIRKVEYFIAGLYSVVLMDGRQGTAKSVGQALAKAKQS